MQSGRKWSFKKKCYFCNSSSTHFALLLQITHDAMCIQRTSTQTYLNVAILWVNGFLPLAHCVCVWCQVKAKNVCSSHKNKCIFRSVQCSFTHFLQFGNSWNSQYFPHFFLSPSKTTDSDIRQRTTNYCSVGWCCCCC